MAALTVVGICGKARVGKDALADHLVSRYGFVRLKFAAPLKRAACHLFGWTEEALEGDDKDQPDARYGGLAPRQLLQWLGTEVMQHHIQDVLPGIGRTFFAERLVRDIRLAQETQACGAGVVVSDLRFPHEHQCLQRHFGDRYVSVRVCRPSVQQDSSSSSWRQHVSETEVECVPTSVVVDNTGTKEQLHAAFEQQIHERRLTHLFPPVCLERSASHD
jgi:hypothetical protein